MARKNLTFGEAPPRGLPVVVGIDPSYTGFGLTILEPKSGKFQTTVMGFEGLGVVRLSNICVEMSEAIGPYKVKEIALESPVKMSHAALMMGELFGAVRLTLLHHHDLFPLQVPPTMVKKYASGKGTGVQKNQMLLEVYKRWDVEFSDDNAADSFVLAKIAAKEASTDFQKDVLKKLEDPKFRDPAYF